MPQEAFLFTGIVRDNIAYGRPAASDEDVEAAARAVGAHDVVAGLPNGYLTVLGERGGSLSSGQRQLIALARAQLADPALLLLDEATSNLDLATESRVNAAMRAVARGRTTIVIAHRLQTAAAPTASCCSSGRVRKPAPTPSCWRRTGPTRACGVPSTLAAEPATAGHGACPPRPVPSLRRPVPPSPALVPGRSSFGSNAATLGTEAGLTSAHPESKVSPMPLIPAPSIRSGVSRAVKIRRLSRQWGCSRLSVLSRLQRWMMTAAGAATGHTCDGSVGSGRRITRSRAWRSCRPTCSFTPATPSSGSRDQRKAHM